MKPLDKFFTDNPAWHEKIGAIHALLERVKISEEQSGDVLHLRKRNRILSVHASTAIEGNQLTVSQVTDVINGKPVWGPPKDIKEVQNAWHAYNEMPGYAPWAANDLLLAHSHLLDTLPGESGQFRSGGVAVVGADGALLHRGAPAVQVLSLWRNCSIGGKAAMRIRSSKARPFTTGWNTFTRFVMAMEG